MTRDGFLALSGIIWADGVVDDAEAVALRAAARAVGLEGSDLGYIEDAIDRPVNLETLDLADITTSDRQLLYAIGVWLAAVDGDVQAAETAALAALANDLGLDEAQRSSGVRASVGIASLALAQGRGTAVLQLCRQIELRAPGSGDVAH
jgi:uncharacterized membrane protein YebE (DUF533 family)